jgi:hypothetical protein
MNSFFREITNELGKPLDPYQKEGAFSVEKLIYDIVNKNFEVDTKGLEEINKICKKIDVVGKLRLFYNYELTKKIENSLVRTEYLFYLLLILLRYHETNKNYKFLNTALKICDDIDVCNYMSKFPLIDKYIKDFLRL